MLKRALKTKTFCQRMNGKRTTSDLQLQQQETRNNGQMLMLIETHTMNFEDIFFVSEFHSSLQLYMQTSWSMQSDIKRVGRQSNEIQQTITHSFARSPAHSHIGPFNKNQLIKL